MNKKWHFKQLLLLCVLFISFSCYAQHEKAKISLKDSVDGGFDLSDYIIDAHGFVPVPYFITEPALGGFGFALIPVFIKKRPPYIDSIKGQRVVTPIAPDITGGAGLYTVNGSWFTGLFRSGTFVKSRIKYIAGGGFGSINMNYYRTIPNKGEKEFAFNIKAYAASLQATKRIGYSHWYAGLKYFLAGTDVKYKGSDTATFVKPIEYSSIVSQLGAIIELDNRDNIFTPDKGMKLHVDAIRSDNIFGSDYDYWRMNYYTYMYKPLTKKLIGGLRIDGQQTFGDVPFWLLPYIDMRGVAANRYQGNADILSEAEFRWDFYRRWSIMLFSGAGKAFDDWSDFGSSKWVISYGTGFRYLIARKFGLRMGIDIAKGPDQWAYYIVFGSNWLK
jgi:hypothetical protein